ncbi:50S ribosomal protein L32 [Candidatus Gracilibacteria bacterium]|nr:50S ribosomal protein L32 [Candidatus Gracilibacteria bacterium]
MSKKPVPSKKQAVSSTRSRHGAYVRKVRTKLANASSLDTCPKCKSTKKRHFACQECGTYNDRQVFEPKSKKSAAPIQEIEA